MKRRTVWRYVATGLAVVGVFMMTGCMATDTVSSRFPLLQDNINVAKAADAAAYAPNPLRSAETKLAEAKAAVRVGDMVTASKLVDEAMVDADYARAKAPTEKTKGDIIKLREEIKALRAEIKTMSAVQPTNQ